jgi:hypothetical protein
MRNMSAQLAMLCLWAHRSPMAAASSMARMCLMGLGILAMAWRVSQPTSGKCRRSGSARCRNFGSWGGVQGRGDRGSVDRPGGPSYIGRRQVSDFGTRVVWRLFGLRSRKARPGRKGQRCLQGLRRINGTACCVFIGDTGCDALRPTWEPGAPAPSPQAFRAAPRIIFEAPTADEIRTAGAGQLSDFGTRVVSYDRNRRKRLVAASGVFGAKREPRFKYTGREKMLGGFAYCFHGDTACD